LKRPRLTIIAGANGSGKTTLTGWNSDLFRAIPILDPDAIARTLQTTSPAFPIAAARQVLASAKEHLGKHESFAVETTLAGKHYLQMMVDARICGFEVVLVYIGTENVEINLARIRNRVLVGGHNVPESDVRRRYQRSFENLPIGIGAPTTLFCSIIQQKKGTGLSRFSGRQKISGSSLFQTGQRR
jgi:predicted ABC-type ATPase